MLKARVDAALEKFKKASGHDNNKILGSVVESMAAKATSPDLTETEREVYTKTLEDIVGDLK